jgi:hypothetical protein
MLAIGLFYIAFIMRYDPLILTFFKLSHKEMLNFVKGSFCIYCDDLMISPLILLVLMYYAIQFMCVEHLCLPGMKPT